MRITVSAFRADLGGIGGHLQPSATVCQAVADYIHKDLDALIVDSDVGFTGDDITIVATHRLGRNAPEIHEGLTEALRCGARQATAEGLYGSGQDLDHIGRLKIVLVDHQVITQTKQNRLVSQKEG